MAATVTSVAVVVGSTRRVSFQITGTAVSEPTVYNVSLAGTTAAGQVFASTNTASLTIIPAAAISISPGAASVGQQVSVSIIGQNTSFVQGSTKANFGPGISVDGAAEGAYGSVTVVSPTSATAQLTINPQPPSAQVRAVGFGSFSAQAVSLTFDSLAPGTIVGKTYQSQGIVFANAVVASDSSAPSSPNKIVSANSTPLQILFPAGIKRVGIQIDSDGFCCGRQPQIRGYGASGELLGSQNFAQGSDFKGFEATTGLIYAIELGSTSSGDPASFAFSDGYDNLVFDTSPATVATGVQQASAFFAINFTPVLIHVSPNSAQQGQQNLGVTITGQFTNFVQGTTQVSFGTGITVSTVTVTDASHLTAQVTIDPAATLGGRTVAVATGGEIASLANGLTVLAGAPALTQVTPNTGQQGATNLPVTITGNFTHFSNSSVVTFANSAVKAGAPISATTTSLTVPVSITAAAALGAVNVTVTTGAEEVTLNNSFTVTAGTPVLLTVNPSAGLQGQQNLAVTITGQFTHFVQGTSQVSLGAGITVNSVSVASAIALTAQVTVAVNAAIGPRTVTATTGTEITSLPSFAVTAPANQPPVVSAGPDLPATLLNPQTIVGTVTDDSLPNPPGTVTITWSKVSGPGSVSFSSLTTAATAATFDRLGKYVLRLTASDSVATASDDVMVTVGCPAGPYPVGSIAFCDDFERPDGPVGNSWSTWFGPTYNDPTIQIASGELSTRGFFGDAGGIFRDLPLSLPISFAFDFRPVGSGTNSCTAGPVNEFSWGIAFNRTSSLAETPLKATALRQIGYEQFAGSRNIDRLYSNGSVLIVDHSPNLPEPIATQRDFLTGFVAHIEGVVNSDLSTTLTVYYNDGLSPASTTFTFGPAVGAASAPPGPMLAFGNNTCNPGLFFFDNLDIRGTLSPSISSVTPNSGQQGEQNLSVNVTGQFTNFVQGTTAVSLGAGITVASLTINSPTTATATINIDSAAVLGSRNVTLTTGAELVVLTNGFAVTAGTPTITQVNPTTGQQGATSVPVTITGNFTHFSSSSVVTFSNGAVTAGAPTAETATSLTVPVSITAAASLGVTSVTVTTGTEVLTLTNSFTVTAGTPVLLTVNPASGQQGQQNLLVLIAGQFTHFVQGTTTVAFGTGITVNSITIANSTALSANISIALNTAVGGRAITVTTGAEVVSLPNGFTIQANNVCISPPPNLVSWWPGNGSTVDLVRGSSGTLQSGAGYTPGFVGQAFSFDGIAAFVNIPDPASFSSTSSAITFEGWINPQSIPTGETLATIFARRDPFVSEGFMVSIDNAGTADSTANIALEIRTTDSPTIYGSHFSSSSRVIQFGQWQHLAVTANTVTGLVKVYLNGQSVALTNTFPPASLTGSLLWNSLHNLFIGQRQTIEPIEGISGGAHFNGLVDEATLYSVELTQDQIQTIYAAGSAGKCRNLPVITSIDPSTGQQGTTNVPVTITGNFTHFSSSSVVTFSNGAVTAGTPTVATATSLTVPVSIAAVASLGDSNVTVTTGDEVVTLNNGFTATAGTPVLLTVSPTSGPQGQQTLPITLTGQFSHFLQGTTRASFGAGITVAPLTVNSPTTANATINIDPAAPIGPRTVTLTTGAEIVALTTGFTVTAGASTKPDLTISKSHVGSFVSGQLGAVYTISVNNIGTAPTTGNVSVGDALPTGLTATNMSGVGWGCTLSTLNCTRSDSLAAGSAYPPIVLTVNVAGSTSTVVGDIVNDFSPVENPGLAWTYGWTPSLGGAITPYGVVDNNSVPGITAWLASGTYSDNPPYVAHNDTANTVSHLTFRVPSDELHLHPGSSGQDTVVRWTAPASGIYLVSGLFEGLDSTSTDVHILRNGISLFDSAITGDGAVAPFNLNAALSIGDTLDFAVGFGTGGYFNDSTGLKGTIALAPVMFSVTNTATVSGGGEVNTANDTATDLTAVSPSTPLLSGLSPSSGQQGQQNLSVTIVGQLTNFVQGTSQVSFGAGITVTTVTVANANSLTAQINIDPTATLGVRSVTVTTGTEVATLSNGFTVNANVCVVPPSGLVAWWAGDGNYSDIIGHNDGAPVGTVAFSAGEVGQAFSFNGASSVVVPSGPSLLLGTGEMTLDAWIRSPPYAGASDTTVIFGKYKPQSGGHGYYLQTRSDNRVEFIASDCGTGACGFGGSGSGAPKQPVHSLSVVADNQWHHVAGIRRADGTREIYVDGALENTRSESMWDTDSDNPLYIGELDGTDTSYHFIGLIDEVDIFNRALSASEVQAIFSAESAGKCKPQLGTSVISSVIPNTGQQGQSNLSVAITGQFTHFVQGTTTASFGAGITVTSLTVNSTTLATAVLSINLAATAGPRSVTLTTGSEIAALANAFAVQTTPNQAPVVSAGSNQTITIPPAPVVFTEFPTTVSMPDAITSGPDGNLWFAENQANKIGRITPAGVVTEFPVPTQPCCSGGGGLTGIVLGPDNNLWFVEYFGGKIWRMTTSGIFTSFPAGGSPVGLAVGADGNLWFTLRFGNAIGRITPDGTITAFPVPTNGAQPYEIAAGPDGNLWFTEVGVNKIGRITTAGAIVEFLTPSSGGVPFGITGGPDGNVWFTDNSSNKIGRITPTGTFTEFSIPTAGTNVADVTVGADGNLWFVERFGNNVGRVTTAGVITEFPVPTGDSQPVALAVGPDCNLWFTEQQANKIGKINFPYTPVTAALSGSIIDDGLPLGATLSTAWSRISGGCDVSFASSTATFPDAPSQLNPIVTSATFKVPGTYTLGLTGSDSLLSGNSSVTITVNPQLPTILSVNPNTGLQGQQNLSVGITGRFTHFVQGTTQVSLGTGITVGTVTVASATSVTAQVTIDPSATLGPRTVTVTTGTEVAGLANGFTITSAAVPSITQVSPNAGQQGQGGPLGIVGQNTNFVQGVTTLDLGPGITVSSVTVTCATCLTAQVVIAANAAAGPRTVTATTGAEVAQLANGFTVLAGTPILTSMVPASGRQGQSVTSTITGQFTNWVQGTTTVSLGAGITVNAVTVTNPTTLTVQLTVAPNAVLGLRSLTVPTGAEIVSATNVFNVLAGLPVVTLVNPSTSQQGQSTLPITITGQFTNFVQGTSQVSFGAGVTVNSTTVASLTSLTANISIAANAAAGLRTVTVTTGAEVASMANGFTVLSTTPVLLSVSPNTGQPGQSGPVMITGQSTNFVQGTSQVSFGAGITVSAVTVTSSTSLIAQITVTANATVGARTVTVSSVTEIEALTNGFTVQQGTPILTFIDPSGAQQGQTLSVTLTGQSTNWVQGTTAVSLGSGVTVNSVTVADATDLTAQVTIALTATVGSRTATVTTGTEVESAANAFDVLAAGVQVLSAIPNSGRQGQSNLSVAITGLNTHFVQGSSQATFGSTAVVVNSITVTDSTHLTANISIATNAAAVPRTIVVTTAAEVATLPNGFTVTTGTNQAPVITINPTWSVTLPNRLVLTYVVTDDGLPLGGSLTTSWDTITTPPDATVGYQDQTLTSISAGFSDPGTYTLRITSTDTQFTVSQDVTVTVTGNPIPGPAVSLTSPTDGAEITAPVNVIGTADSPNLANWTLEFKPIEETVFRTLATGTAPVINGVLGTFDPTILLNGIVQIQLSATDTFGQTTTVQISVVLTKNQKIGNFTVSFNDLSVPVAGLPIQIVRTYDSRSRILGDFGAGWRLDLNAVRLSETTIAGDQWSATTSGGAFPTYCIQPVKPHVVTVSLPDGTTYTFDLTLTPQCQQFVPPDQVIFGFAPRSGTVASLSVLGNNLADVSASFPGDAQLFDQLSGEPFDIDRYRLTLPDGRMLDINQATGGLEKMTDLNGNTLTITSGGIIHSSGKSVLFTRDTVGRITQLTDPAGNSIFYNYLGGNLASVTDRANNVTNFTYDGNHGLLSIIDPRGVQPIRNVYDNSGRLIQHIDAFGNIINYTNDLAGHQEIVTDRLGNTTVNEYDADGNIVKITDALGGVTTRTYDSQDNMLTEINPLGKQRTYTYDSQNNRLSETDPLGNTTLYTYNSHGQVLTITDPRLGVTTNNYDAGGNLLSTTDAASNVTSYNYNASGLRTSMTDPLGGITSYQYDASGNLTQQADALGNVTTYTYDTNGNRLTETKARTTTSGQETLVTSYQYDNLSRITQTTYPDGSTTQIQYNAIGKQSLTTDQLGHQTSYQYDLMGRLTQTNYADRTLDGTSYDAEGDRISSTDRGNRITSYGYDPLKRLTTTTYPDGAVNQTTYDAAGQVTKVTDPRGNATTYGYDDAGRRTSVTDALAHATLFTYDIAGNQASMQDANGNKTQYQYDALNRRTRVIYPDTTFESTGYDALGRTVSKTDQAGVVTRYQYDKLGRLTMVTDALSQTTRYIYDELGNRLTQIDAKSDTTTFAYDKLGRRTKRTLPLGMFETMTYDAAGNLKTKTDFNGKTTTYAYDSVNRLTSETPDTSLGEPTVSFTYTSTGQRASMVDASGTSTYTYDSRDRLLTKATPEGTLTYTYDLQGDLMTIRSSNAGGTSVDYGYDALNRLSTTKDNRFTTGTTSYSYDASGALSGYLYPNGVQTSYSYNTLNRLLAMSIEKSGTLASYAYTLGTAGNRTAVAELGGRQLNYTYDSLYRLINETIAGSTLNGAIGYTYDAVGNRLSRASTVTPVVPTTSSYDANDRLTTDTYDNNGNTTISGSNLYDYDFANRLKSQTAGTVVTIVYDGDGNRVAKTVGGVTTKYLVDDRNLTGYAQVLEEVTNTVQRVYTYGLNRISQGQASGTSFYGYDGHGSVRLLTDTTGAVTDRFDYDAFGNIIGQLGTTPNLYLYAGEQRDSSLDLYFNRARYYSQRLGRFWTMDTFDNQLDDSSAMNKYSYANADPADNVDPTGNQATLVELEAEQTVEVNILQQVIVPSFLAVPSILKKVSEAETDLNPLRLYRGFRTKSVSPSSFKDNPFSTFEDPPYTTEAQTAKWDCAIRFTVQSNRESRQSGLANAVVDPNFIGLATYNPNPIAGGGPVVFGHWDVTSFDSDSTGELVTLARKEKQAGCRLP